jgi:hypothetical protein
LPLLPVNCGVIDSNHKCTAVSTFHAAESRKKIASEWEQFSTEMKATIMSSFESFVDKVFILEHTKRI